MYYYGYFSRISKVNKNGKNILQKSFPKQLSLWINQTDLACVLQLLPFVSGLFDFEQVSCHLDIAEANDEISKDLHRAWILSLSAHSLLVCPSLRGVSSGKSPEKDQHFLKLCKYVFWQMVSKRVQGQPVLN